MRKFILSGEVNDSIVKELINNILEINEHDNREEKIKENYYREPIYLYINSFGGSVYAGLGLIDIMTASKTPVYTVCIGNAMSMGLIILLSGKKRFIGRNSTIMCHGVSAMTLGKTPEMSEDLEEFKRLELLLTDIIVENTKIKRNKIEDIIEKKQNWFIPAKEALKLGIVDDYLEKI